MVVEVMASTTMTGGCRSRGIVDGDVPNGSGVNQRSGHGVSM